MLALAQAGAGVGVRCWRHRGSRVYGTLLRLPTALALPAARTGTSARPAGRAARGQVTPIGCVCGGARGHSDGFFDRRATVAGFWW